MELCPESEAVSSPSWLRARGVARTPLLALVAPREGDEEEEDVESDLDAVLLASSSDLDG